MCFDTGDEQEEEEEETTCAQVKEHQCTGL